MPRRSFGSALAASLNPPKIDVYAALGYQPACVPYIGGQIPEPCGQCPQEQFAAATEFSVLYGGASGGGKTLAALCWALRACAEHPGMRIGAFRRSYPELRESLLAELANLGFAEALGATWHGSEHELSLPNRSVIAFRYAESVKDASRRQGSQYQAVVLDELTLLDPAVVTFLESRLRSGRSSIPVLGVRATSNPEGPGHGDVKKRFIVSTAYGSKVVTDERGRSLRFISARAADNPFLNKEYTADLMRLPEAQRAAFLDGNWDVFAGMMYPELSRDRHVVRPMTLPSEWRRVAGVDWGYSKPFACIWLAEDEDHRLWAYRELYAVQVGEAEQARRILEAEGDEQVSIRWADSAMWSVRGDAPPLAKGYEDAGCHIEPSAKGPGSRVAGWQRLRSFLAEGPAARITGRWAGRRALSCTSSALARISGVSSASCHTPRRGPTPKTPIPAWTITSATRSGTPYPGSAPASRSSSSWTTPPRHRSPAACPARWSAPPLVECQPSGQCMILTCCRTRGPLPLRPCTSRSNSQTWARSPIGAPRKSVLGVGSVTSPSGVHREALQVRSSSALTKVEVIASAPAAPRPRPLI